MPSTPRPQASSAPDGTSGAGDAVPLGLRERKKLALRQRLSATATAMFLERGFDNVRVSDVANACDVSLKTVYNHFPTKESLLFDRGDSLAAVFEDAMRHPHDVLAAVVALMRADNERLADGRPPTATSSDSETIGYVHAFAELVGSTPALRAAVSEQLQRLTELAARAIAVQCDTEVDAPETRIAASALISLWSVQLTTLLRFAGTNEKLGVVQAAVQHDTDRGVRVVRSLFRTARLAPRR